MHLRLVEQGPGHMAARLPFTDIHLFMRAVALAVTRGLSPDDIRSVQACWSFAHETFVACGFILDMQGPKVQGLGVQGLGVQGRERVYLEYCRDEASEALDERIVVQALAADTLYPRPSPHLPPVHWSTRVGHLNIRLPRVG